MKKITSILLVDDDRDDRDLFCEALSLVDDSIKVKFAINGVDALKQIESGIISPDIVFLDVNMPLMNGFQVLEKMNELEHLRSLPVIMYTTSSSQQNKAQSRLLGAKYYIVKPTSFDKICIEIRLALDYVRKHPNLKKQLNLDSLRS